MYSRKNPKANLENKRKVFLEIGFIVALLLVLAAFEYRSYEKNTIDLMMVNPYTDPFELPPLIIQKKEKPMPPAKHIKLNPVDVSKGDFEDIIIDVGIDDTWEVPEYEYTKKDADDFVPDDILFTSAEQPAEFPGGLKALYSFLRDNIKYPQLAREAQISGTVYIEFVVEKDGAITNPTILRSVGGGCDEEAIRMIETMPPWIPAMQNKRPVRYRLTLPVKFILQ